MRVYNTSGLVAPCTCIWFGRRSNTIILGRETTMTGGVFEKKIGGPEKGRFRCLTVNKIGRARRRLTSETVQGTSLPLQSVDDVHGGDGLPLGVFGVCDGVTDYVFQKHLQHTTGFFVDQPRDTFDSTTAS